MNVPQVSVILPVYDRPAYLRPAIESVFGQTFAAWELLIVDDGSEDPGTLAILAGLDDPRVRVLRLAHSGSPSVARNAGIAAARGEYVAFLDSDDLWPPEKIAVQLAALRARPACGWSYGAIQSIDNDGVLQDGSNAPAWVPYEDRMVERLLRAQARIATPAVMMRRDLLDTLGGFDVELRYAEDYDLWTRAALRSEVVALDQVLASIRRYPRPHDSVSALRCWIGYYDKFARQAPDRTLRRLAWRCKAVRALQLARLLASRPGGSAEASQLVVSHVPALLLQPREWPAVVRFVAKWLLTSMVHRRLPAQAA